MTIPRHAVPADRAGAVGALADAFATDPVFTLLFDPAGERAAADLMDEVMGIAYDAFTVNGHTYVIDDRAAALWSPPGVTTDTERLSAFFGEHAIPERMEAAVPGFIEMAECHPTDPHFYLQFVGVHEAARGQGLGSLLLERVLQTCDTEGLPAYLEASSRGSRALYLRHGFEELTTITLAEDVSLWPMLRPPAGEHQR